MNPGSGPGKTAFLLGWLAAVLLSACANWKTRSEAQATTQTAALPAAKSESAPKPREESTTARATSAVEQIENLRIDDVIRYEEPNAHTMYDNSRYDFPITVNGKVEGWIDYFTGRGRRHFERYLARSSRYIPVMKHIFRKEGLPEDLVYLAMIESGFNMRARSRARAVGPWQFIAGTGKRYGLQITNFVDERRDPLRSTVAAGKYLKDLYLMFESWYLAAAAYNAGENKILRAMDTLKTNNYWAISQTRHIRRETKDYVPKLIAAAIIAKNPERYGFEEIAYMDPLEFDVVQVDYALRIADIAQLINAQPDELLDLNPELYRGIVPPDAKDYQLRIPRGSQALVSRALVAKQDELSKAIRPVTYRIRRGDNLGTIARRHGVSVGDILDINEIKNARRLHPGQEILIPAFGGNTGGAQTRTVSREKASYTPREVKSGRYISHRVTAGESLWSISVKYNVTVREIFKWNKLKNSRIYPGKKLRIIPGANEA